jgi:hypothetical protein
MSKESLWDIDWDKIIEDRFGVDVETLSKYAEAHKAGKALTVPCKKGDILFVLTTDSLDGIEETKCKKIEIVNRNGKLTAKVIAPCTLDDWGGAFREFYPEDFGVKVFDNKDMALAMLNMKKEVKKSMDSVFEKYKSGKVSYRHLHDTLKGEFGREIEFSGIEEMKSYIVNFFKQGEGFPIREDDIVIEKDSKYNDWHGWNNVHPVGITSLWGIKHDFVNRIGYCTFL